MVTIGQIKSADTLCADGTRAVLVVAKTLIHVGSGSGSGGGGEWATEGPYHEQNSEPDEKDETKREVQYG